MNLLIANTIAYSLIIITTFIILNFLTSGFITNFIKTKAARGKKALLFVEGRTGNYYRTGEIKEDELYYINREKVKKIITIKEGQVRRIMNIPFLMIDDIKNAILNPDYTTATGHDAANVDNLLTRAMMAPTTMLEKLVRIILLATIITIILVIVVGLLTFATKQGLLPIRNACETAAQNTIQIKQILTNTTI